MRQPGAEKVTEKNQYDERRNRRQSRHRRGTGRARRAGEASPKKGARQKKGASKGQKAAKGGKAKAKKAAKPARAKDASVPRAESKGARILGLIGRAKGASLAEIMKATDWQAHSVRGYLSTAAKKRGIKIESRKTEAGDRVYKIAR